MSTSIRNVAVIGMGTMGNGIAQVSAMAGYQTLVFDTRIEGLEKGLQAIAGNLEKGVAKGKVSEANAQQALGRLEAVVDLPEAAGRADLVIEAAPEHMDLKIALFKELAGVALPDAIFATNTSGLSITELAATTDRPDRVVGMHFFNPVHIMKLVELVRGLDTSDETLAAVSAVAARMGKGIVTINESPGFVTSRINALIGNEAFDMLECGVASPEDIDKALKLGLNHPMGPFEMVNLVGLDVRLRVLENLHVTLGERYRPSPLLVKYVKAGRLGRKVGRGVYAYDEAGKRR